jgi:hypothetical protein
MLKKVKTFFNKIDGVYPISSIERRKQNIQYLFTHTIQWMPTVIKIYDANYFRLKDHKKAKDQTFEDLQLLEN